MRKTQPAYGWHTPTVGCDTPDCQDPKIGDAVVYKQSGTLTSLVELTCVGDGKKFTVLKATYDSAVRNRHQKNFYCSPQCLGKASRSKQKYVVAQTQRMCLNCNEKFFPNPGSTGKYCSFDCFIQYRKNTKASRKCHNCSDPFTVKPSSKQIYCSKRCSIAARSNMGYKKRNTIRIETGICPKCKKHPIYNKETSCVECKFEARWGHSAKDDYATITLQDLRLRYDVYQYHAKIRGNARGVYAKNRGNMSCLKCDYMYHVDIAHLQNVSSFPPNALISDVNAFSNLVALCKNHHKEFDASKKNQIRYKGSLVTNRSLTTLIDLQNTQSKRWHSILRSDSRATYFAATKSASCKICGYDLHVDVAHIKAVKDFADSSTVARVNAISNLVALCPNHHWEFDHGLITL